MAGGGDFITDLADRLAQDALAAEAELEDDRLIEQLSTTIGAASQTLQEAFMTSVRIRRAEQRGRLWLTQRIAKAKAWSYSAGFELRLAAQDTAEITIGLNFAPPVGTELFIGGAPDPFAALSEFAANAAAITADLQTLVSGSGGGAPGLSAVLAIADIAGKVAENWGFVSNDGQGGGGPVDDLVPEDADIGDFPVIYEAK